MKTFQARGFTILNICCAVFVLFTAGCANQYQRHYQSTLEKWPGAVSSSILKPAGAPQLLSSDDMKKDAHAMLEKGFVLMGRVTFRDVKLDESTALQQAEAIGAWVVLVSNKYVGTQSKSQPMSQWSPDQTITTTENVQIQNDPNKPPVQIQRQVTQTILGQVQTSYIPVSVDYYEYSATFWAKTKLPLLGVLVQPMTDELKKKYQTNKGLVVKIVIQGSPAYKADVLEGDVLMSLAEEGVEAPDQFFGIISRHAGETVALNLFRDGQAKTIHLTLNANQ